MALKLYDTLTPDGDYPLMKAKDVEMPDGTRLSEFEGGGGGSVSWEDMPDKPFYEEQDREEILAELYFSTHYISNYGAYGYGFNFSDETPLFPLALGDKCVVHWDGNEYEVTVGDSSVVLADTLYIGNGSAFGLSGNEEPFAIAWDTTGETGVTIFSTVDTVGTTHLVAIYQDTKVIKPLDPKFLPVATAVDLTAFESEGKIVETYADGSTVTTTMERNAEGKITKITDSNGNVTVLTR